MPWIIALLHVIGYFIGKRDTGRDKIYVLITQYYDYLTISDNRNALDYFINVPLEILINLYYRNEFSSK